MFVLQSTVQGNYGRLAPSTTSPLDDAKYRHQLKNEYIMRIISWL